MVGEKSDIPETANWEYTIKAVPLKNDVPTNRLRPVDNLNAQLMHYPRSLTQEQLKKTRLARFRLNQADSDTWHEGAHGRNFLDSLMEQIPGKDNFLANLTDRTGGEQSMTYSKGGLLNVGYYSRYYSVGNKDASGRSGRKRGFNDPSLWAAKTSHNKVSGLTYNDGFGNTKCPLTDVCAKQIAGYVKGGEDAGYTNDQIWQYAVHTGVSHRNKKCPAPAVAVSEDWKTDKTYLSDEQLMCRWKITNEYRNLYHNLPKKPTHVDPSCGKLEPEVANTDASRAEWKKCPREKTVEKWSYAIPMEIIYLTPLQTWNPYNLKMKSDVVQTANGRTGGQTAETAWDGISWLNYYMTPSEFYSGGTGISDPADTSKRGAGVLDENGNIVKVEASGIPILYQNIDGVGSNIRARHAIYPTHDEGNPSWKELKALEAVQLTGDQAMTASVREEALGIKFELTFASGHVHTIQVPGHILVTKLAKEGDTWVASSSLNNGHEHQVTIKRGKDNAFEMVSMDPPEAHKLVAVSQIGQVKDAAPAPAPAGGAAATPVPVIAKAENATEVAAKFAAVKLAIDRVQKEIETLKAAANAPSCGAYGEVVSQLKEMEA